MKKIVKIATYCMIGTLTLFGKCIETKAAGMPMAGISLTLKEHHLATGSDNSDIIKYLNEFEKSQYENIGIAVVTDYMNIRSEPSEESEILGKLYKDSGAKIINNEGDWYKVESGSVTGYVKSEYLVTGEQVEEFAKTIGKRIATVTTTTLKVRDSANLDATVQTLVPIEEELIVEEELDDWVKVSIDADIVGYVSSEYVELRTEFKEAESIEEEKARIELEEARNEAEEARIEAEELKRKATEEKTITSKTENKLETSTGSTPSETATDNTSSSREKVVNYALQFVGNPYKWGGTSLTHGADCSGFTQSVFSDNGIIIPRTSREQAVGGGRQVTVDTMKPGDLIFYDRSGTINHVGIYIGNGKVVSASSEKTGIRVTNYNYRQPYKIMNYID